MMKLTDRINDLKHNSEHLNTSQRALVASVIRRYYLQAPGLARDEAGMANATLKAAGDLNISAGLVHSADALLASEDKELIDLVIHGSMSVTMAAKLAKQGTSPRLRKLLNSWQSCPGSDRLEFLRRLTARLENEKTQCKISQTNEISETASGRCR